MEQATRTQIILAAVTAVGPVVDGDAAAWNAAVEAQAISISIMTGPTGQISKTLDGIENWSAFTTTIAAVSKEQSSTRGLVSLQGPPSDRHPDGIEKMRTERTDNPSGLAMAKRLRSLIGHRVVVWKEIQETDKKDVKVRVIRHVEDIGVDPAFVVATG